MSTIKITRTHQKFVDQTGTEGVRLVIEVGDGKFPAIERGGNFLSVPAGAYMARCDYWAPRSEPTKEVMAIRLPGVHDRDSFLIHPANWPRQLEGCIAPGLTQHRYGVSHSREAMAQIFRLIGGWELGKEVLVEIDASDRKMSQHVAPSHVAFNR